ncbi:hypothetical protein [Priestia megaterium]|uniref:hypothetical protein n=1 Tax=Priestia megaterium TaxID=1404 RepID=UPI001BE6EB26|nr:hypothetical protein [Priestia megaterium]MBT2259277.1 hypothetical protein [Priestia megaterium]
MENTLLFFGVTTMIIYGVAIVQNVIREKTSLFKGWLALATISLGMFIQTMILQDGIRVEAVMSPYGTDNIVRYEVMKYTVGIFSFLTLTVILYGTTYIASRVIFKFLVNGNYIGKSRVIDYFIAPIAFLLINYYVSFDYLMR